MMSCLPFCATDPVSAILKPTLIGSAARAGALKDERNKTNKNKRAATLRSLNMGVSPSLSSPLTRLPHWTRKPTSPPGEVDHFIISSLGRIPHKFDADGSLAQIFGRCGLS